MLTEKLEDEKTSTEVKKACLSALKLQNGTRASEATVKLLKSRDPELRALAVSKLWDNYDHYYDVIALANDKSSLVRMEVLKQFDSGMFNEKCQDFLNDKDEVIVAKAIETISRYPDKRAIPALEKFLKTTKSEDLKRKANTLIEQINRKGY